MQKGGDVILQCQRSGMRPLRMGDLLRRKVRSLRRCFMLAAFCPLRIIGVRRASAAALGSYGEQAVRAVPALIKALKDPEVNVRNAAAGALRKIDPEAATEAGVM